MELDFSTHLNQFEPNQFLARAATCPQVAPSTAAAMARHRPERSESGAVKVSIDISHLTHRAEFDQYLTAGRIVLSHFGEYLLSGGRFATTDPGHRRFHRLCTL